METELCLRLPGQYGQTNAPKVCVCFLHFKISASRCFWNRRLCTLINEATAKTMISRKQVGERTGSGKREASGRWTRAVGRRSGSVRSARSLSGGRRAGGRQASERARGRGRVLVVLAQLRADGLEFVLLFESSELELCCLVICTYMWFRFPAWRLHNSLCCGFYFAFVLLRGFY